MLSASKTYSPDALASLRDSFSLHLSATRAPQIRDMYLAALDSLLGHFGSKGMPMTVGAVRRERVEVMGAIAPRAARTGIALAPIPGLGPVLEVGRRREHGPLCILNPRADASAGYRGRDDSFSVTRAEACVSAGTVEAD